MPNLPPKGETPVLGTTPAIIGALQSMEVIKHLLGIKSSLKGKMLIFDGKDFVFDVLKLEKRVNYMWGDG